ncbi:MAG: hypothetical protein EAZ57_04510 [Cytophagales bacterium]|nr:MAG: hypothetical protein EAZ67_05530 [Cytophagales bacterium]TAF61258.1 MAG: hypothetical protein EAZ57_04510 [Cytophagales bacterium]
MKNLKFLCLILACLLTGGESKLLAQNGCGTVLDEASYEAMRQKVQDMLKNKRLTVGCNDPYASCPDIPYLIPVVFHVVQNQNGLANYPITDVQLEKLIVELNQVFAGTHTAQTTIDPDFAPVSAGNTKIRFKRTNVDPSGAPHSGIERRTTWKSAFYPDAYTNEETSINASNSGDIVKYEASGGLDA